MSEGKYTGREILATIKYVTNCKSLGEHSGLKEGYVALQLEVVAVAEIPVVMSVRHHELKTWPEYFEAVNQGKKTFEIRKNDRKFIVGDYALLQEWEPI